LRFSLQKFAFRPTLPNAIKLSLLLSSRAPFTIRNHSSTARTNAHANTSNECQKSAPRTTEYYCHWLHYNFSKKELHIQPDFGAPSSALIAWSLAQPFKISLRQDDGAVASHSRLMRHVRVSRVDDTVGLNGHTFDVHEIKKAPLSNLYKE